MVCITFFVGFVDVRQEILIYVFIVRVRMRICLFLISTCQNVHLEICSNDTTGCNQRTEHGNGYGD
jgi:hypothetical protein